MKCPYCGNDESPDSKFCGNCGQPLQQQVSQAAPASQPAVSQMPQPSAAQQPATPAVPLPGGGFAPAPAAPQEPLQPTQPLQPAQSQPQPQQPVAQPAWPQAQQFAQPSGAGVSTPAAPATQPSAATPGRARENAEAQIQGQVHRPHRGRGDRPRVGCRSCPVLHVSRGHLGRNPAAYRRRDLRCVRRRSHRPMAWSPS